METTMNRPGFTLRHETPRGYGDPGYYWESDATGERINLTRDELYEAHQQFSPRSRAISDK